MIPSFGGAPLTGEHLLVSGGCISPRAGASASVEAMLIQDGCVTALGASDEVEDLAPSGTPRLRLDGRTVLPGMVDAHTHVEFSALARADWLDVRGLAPELTCARLETEIASRGDDPGWVIAQGTFLQPLPGRDDLDAVSADVPIIVRESMHRLQANSAALRHAGLDRAAPPVPPGMVIHVDAGGIPTGLIEEGFHLFPIPSVPQTRLASLLHAELRGSFARRGVTTVFEIPATSDGVAAYTALAERGELPTRITLTPVVAPGLSPILKDISDWQPVHFGDGPDTSLIAAGGIKIFVDGDNTQSFDSRQFFASPRGWGAVTRTLDALREELIWATRAGVQVWVHAIGDLAQEFVLEAVEQAAARAGAPSLPTRLEHAGNLALPPELLARMQRAGVIPVPTANFMSTDDGRGLYAYRTLIDAGFRPPGNSDTGGAIAEAPNPWFGIAHMRSRQNRKGVPVAPQEAVSTAEGVRGYTEDAAAAAGLDHVIGRLDPGFAADFAVYDTDPRALEPSEMAEVEAVETYVGGRCTWARHA